MERMVAPVSAQQRKTLDYCAKVAKENGETLETEPSDDGAAIYVTMTAGADWDHEVHTWRMDREGVLVLL